MRCVEGSEVDLVMTKMFSKTKGRKEDFVKFVTESMVKVVVNVGDTKRLQDVPEFFENIRNQVLCMGDEYGNQKNTEVYLPRILRLALAV